MTASQAALGCELAALETPAPVVDLDALERNVARATDYATGHGLALLPHTKTHKTAEIAERQLRAGAAGLTVAKSCEAERFAARGMGPLLLHYPVYGAAKWRRLAEVAGHVPLTVALDSLAAAEPLAVALRTRGVVADVLIELDVGMRRTGLDVAGALALAQAIERLGGGLSVAGISCYPGHVRGSREDVRDGLRAVDATLSAARAALEGAGIRCERVSGGSTATLFDSHETSMTELRPGNYVFLDRSEGRGAWAPDDCALRVHATVVSTSVPGRMVLDAGSKTLGDAPPPAGLQGYGAIVGAPGVTIVALNEEHAVCELGPDAGAWHVGDRVEIVPNHVCTCVNLHDALYAARGGVVEAVYPLLTRGAVR